MSYEHTTIYYMSGTGNSYRVSSWLGEGAEESGSKTEVLAAKKRNLKNANDRKNGKKSGKNSLLGIVFPAHGFTMPWHILKFVFRLPRGGSSHAFCVATRGSFRFGKVFVPGLSGSGTFIVALLLFLKGYRVRGVLSVNMPSNWFSLHPIQGSDSHGKIIHRSRAKVSAFIEQVFTGGRAWISLNNFYELMGGILLSLISVGYLFFGRFFLAKLFFSSKNCNGCGVCATHCSFGAIRMMGKKKPKPFWKYSCESCMRCATLSPKQAIEAGQSWGVLLYFITAIPAAYYLFSLSEQSWLFSVVNILWFYPALFISYLVFHLLLRIPVVNWLFTHTTMTHISSWGRYGDPGCTLTDIDKK